jgi:hypothetical protein
MSGGAAVKAGGGVEEDHPVCTTAFSAGASRRRQSTKNPGRPGIRPAPPLNALGLDRPGDAVPYFLKNAGNARRALRPLLPFGNQPSRRLAHKPREGSPPYFRVGMIQSVRAGKPCGRGVKS